MVTTTAKETKRDALLAIDEARRRIRERKGSPEYDPVTAREQLRQLKGLEEAERKEVRDGVQHV